MAESFLLTKEIAYLKTLDFSLVFENSSGSSRNKMPPQTNDNPHMKPRLTF